MNKPRVIELCQRFRGLRVVVIGDVMLDHYICGEVSRISPEAPVPVLDIQREYFRPGGAGNVALNLIALGARPILFGVIGRDKDAEILRTALLAGGIKITGLTAEKGRPTTVKARMLASNQQILRVDREETRPLSDITRRRMLKSIRATLKGAAAIIISDYAKGAVDPGILREILTLGRKANVPVCVDPKPRRPLPLKGCAMLTPNRKEAFELAGMPDAWVGPKPASHRGLRRAIAHIHRHYAPGVLLVTLGEEGMLVSEKGGPLRHIPTEAREVYDISGAGDTVISTFVLAMVSGADAGEAAGLANRAAGVVVGKRGVAAVTPAELVNWERPRALSPAT